jgi:hypothetical protein
MTNLQTVRRNEQSLVTELSRQVEGRDPLYADLLAALEREARVLEQVVGDLDSESRAADSVAGPSTNEPAGPSRTSRPRDASEPIVDSMLEDLVGESEGEVVQTKKGKTRRHRSSR